MNTIGVAWNPRLQCVELVVDGQPLRQIFNQDDAGVISPFARRFVHEAVENSLEIYRGDFSRRDGLLRGGEIELLICSVCGDLMCGSIIADLDIGAELVTWSRPRWWYPKDDDELDVDEPEEDLGVERWVFSLGDYQSALAQIEGYLARPRWRLIPDERGRLRRAIERRLGLEPKPNPLW